MAPNFRTLDLNLLRVFDATMVEGSLTRAAATLAMTQPAVSHALKRLREHLGEELFERAAHGVRPTPRAEALWPAVRDALAALRQSLAPGDFDPARDEHQFHLAMADSTASLLAPPLVQVIEATGARANLRVLPLTTRDPTALLDSGEADLAVGFFPALITRLVALGDTAHLRHQRLYDTRYVCVMRQGHPLAGRPLALADFVAAHHLLVSFSGRPFGLVDQALAALGHKRRIVLTVNQFATAGRVVSASELLAVLPESFIGATGVAESLAVREIPLALDPVHVEMVWHLRRDADAAHRWLRQQVRQAAGG
jgi:DNA-binding transcriptional LysR family regulator